MPFFITSKFKFNCKCEKEDLDEVKLALDNGKAYISLVHVDSSIAIFVYPSDCYKGQLEINLDGLELTINGDFSAKCKISLSKYKEISSSANAVWTTDGVTIPGMCVPINGDRDAELEVPVLITEKK